MFEIEEIVHSDDDSVKMMISVPDNGYDFDEKKAMDILKKKRVNKPSKKKAYKGKYRNVEGAYRNNAKNYQYDYEEDFYEPENK